MSGKSYQSRKGMRGGQKKASRRSTSSRKMRNRYQLEESAESVGTSAKKLKLSEDTYDVDYDSAFGYRILCFATVFSALSDILAIHAIKKSNSPRQANKVWVSKLSLRVTSAHQCI